MYYYSDRKTPLFLLTVFDKASRADLSEKECKQLALLTTVLKQQYGDNQ